MLAFRKSLKSGFRSSFACQQAVLFALCGCAAALAALVIGGRNAMLSSLAGTAVYVVPSAAVLLAGAWAGRTNPGLGAHIYQIGLLARTFAAAGLIFLVALLYPGLSWPAFLLSLFAAASIPAAGQFFLMK